MDIEVIIEGHEQRIKTLERDMSDMKEVQAEIRSMNDIRCLRIQDIVELAKSGNLPLSRKQAKLIWVISGKDKNVFECLWPNMVRC